MQHIERWVFAVVVSVAGLQLSACSEEPSGYTKVEPAHVEQVEGSELNSVTLTEKAIERIDLKTVVVRETQVTDQSGATVSRKVVPYSSLIYDTQGDTWVYINPEPRKFVRHPVKVDYIEGERAVLVDGPPTDTPVATVGVAELYGAEEGIGH